MSCSWPTRIRQWEKGHKKQTSKTNAAQEDVTEDLRTEGRSVRYDCMQEKAGEE